LTQYRIAVRRVFFLATIFAVLSLAPGCGDAGDDIAQPAAPVEIYPVRGEVIRLMPDDKIAVVKHEDIEGWMKAMTMEFPVKDEAEFAKLSEGAIFEAKVHVQDLEYWLTAISLLPAEEPASEDTAP